MWLIWSVLLDIHGPMQLFPSQDGDLSFMWCHLRTQRSQYIQFWFLEIFWIFHCWIFLVTTFDDYLEKKKMWLLWNDISGAHFLEILLWVTGNFFVFAFLKQSKGFISRFSLVPCFVPFTLAPKYAQRKNKRMFFFWFLYPLRCSNIISKHNIMKEKYLPISSGLGNYQYNTQQTWY